MFPLALIVQDVDDDVVFLSSLLPCNLIDKTHVWTKICSVFLSDLRSSYYPNKFSLDVEDDSDSVITVSISLQDALESHLFY